MYKNVKKHTKGTLYKLPLNNTVSHGISLYFHFPVFVYFYAFTMFPDTLVDRVWHESYS